MELVTREAFKLLGDCKPKNICKELKKLKQKDTKQLEADNTILISQVANLEVELAKKNDKIRQLRVQTESLERIQEVVGASRDVLNKAQLFNNNIKTEGQVSVAKIIPILVNFTMKMEAALVDIWKLVSRSPAGSSLAPPPPPKETPRKEKPLEEVKTLLQQCLVKEVISEIAKIEVPGAVLATTPAAREKKTKSSEPSS